MGLFSQEELQSFKTESSFSSGPNCGECGLYKTSTHPKMKVFGKGKRKILVIGEVSSLDDDHNGYQFAGKIGQFFRNKIKECRLDLEEDFWTINSTGCSPVKKDGKLRDPSDSEVKFCRPYVLQAIEELKPENVWMIGNSAIKSVQLFLSSTTEFSAISMRGNITYDPIYKCFLHPMLSLSLLQKDGKDNANAISVFMRDMKIAIHHIGRKTPEPIDFGRTHLVTDYTQIISLLEKTNLEAQFLYFDYEATGLKPFFPGQKIVSMSFTYDGKDTYSFPVDYRSIWSADEGNQIKKKIKRILINPNIKKGAHRIEFEGVWTEVILGIPLNNWYWDSKIAAHILNNRQPTGLKYLVYSTFGERPYNSEIEKYLDGTPYNNIEKAPLQNILEYGAKDSKYGFHLAQHQIPLIEKHFAWPYKFFLEGIKELASIQINGVDVDEEYFDKQDKELEIEIQNLEKELLNSEEAQKYKEAKGIDISVTSGQQLGVLFYEILGHEKQYTENKNYKTDKKTISGMKGDFITKLQRYKLLTKIKGTYLAQFRRECINGVMNPVGNLVNPVSYRSSVGNPSFQNIPVREEEAKIRTRGGIKAKPGWQILEADFKGIEVCISASYNLDPNMIKYVSDPTTDMHRDTGEDIWKLPESEISKDIRFYAKNNWVFAQFYGDYYVSCGNMLWENCIERFQLKTKSGISLINHLESINIKTKTQFIEHLKEVERIFWKERFFGYDQWKKDNVEAYQKNGFIDSYTGFRYQGYMSRNEANNYVIQGGAFHVLLWTLIHVARELKRLKTKSSLMGQIHDSMIFRLCPEELGLVLKIIQFYAEQKSREIFPWIVVPLKVEFEVAPIAESWIKKKEISESRIIELTKGIDYTGPIYVGGTNA